MADFDDIKSIMNDNNENKNEEKKQENLKENKKNIYIKILTIVGSLFLSLIFLIILLILWLELSNNYIANYKYSIAMPKIRGHFDYNSDFPFVRVWGIENIINEDIASLNINETICFLDKKDFYCDENRAVIIGFGNEISIYPYSKEYKIKYADKDKIIFGDYINTIVGEIDLNAKTLIYTVKNAGFDHNETRRIEIITNNEKIEEIEKKIIRKFLRRKLFER